MRRIASIAAASASIALTFALASWAALAMGGMAFIPLAWVALVLYLRAASMSCWPAKPAPSLRANPLKVITRIAMRPGTIAMRPFHRARND